MQNPSVVAIPDVLSEKDILTFCDTAFPCKCKLALGLIVPMPTLPALLIVILSTPLVANNISVFP